MTSDLMMTKFTSKVLRVTTVTKALMATTMMAASVLMLAAAMMVVAATALDQATESALTKRSHERAKSLTAEAMVAKMLPPTWALAATTAATIEATATMAVAAMMSATVEMAMA